MKNILSFALLLAVISFSSSYGQQKKKSSKTPVAKQQHIAIDSFPSNRMINFLPGWGDMAVAVNSLPAGTDLGPLLVGLKNNTCQVPHWGYIIKGSLRMKYDTGEEVLLKAGELFYMPPGHTGKVEEDLKLFDFSPDEQFTFLVAHLEKKAAEMQAGK
ncbi:hypothetical protein WBG78_14360 [Chryseolinea sp. T2]|uniref:hypothetical protein n=1 Tax=Chryseolinea sp. T2 TaxID=3129255 RepID=UPI0030771DAD